MALIEAGRTQEAVDRLVAFTQTHPTHLGVCYVLGHAYEILERWPEARLSWLAAVRLAGEAPKGDVEQILLAMEAGHASDTPHVEHFDVQEPTLSDDDVVTETWARILAGQAQYEEAARVYSKLAEKHPDDADRYQALASRMQAQVQST